MARSPKEASIIILDIGANSQRCGKQNETFFERAKICISKILQRKIFTKPLDEVGLILMGTAETSNQLNSSIGGYSNICEAFELGIPNWQMLRILEKEIQPSNQTADWIDALVVAMNFLKVSTQAKKFAKLKIILLSTLSKSADKDKIDTIVEALLGMECELNIINDNVEFKESADESTFHEKGIFSQLGFKSQEQKDNEKLVTDIVDRSNGVLCNIDCAELLLVHFQKQATRPMPWNCPLTIGSDFKINISAYVLIQSSKMLKPFKTESSYPDTPVKYQTLYYKNDKLCEPDMENMIKGYYYGSTIVPYDQQSLSLDYKAGPKCFMCIGFTDKSHVMNEYLIGDGAHIVVPQKGAEASEKKFLALVEEMEKLNLWMICRRVYRDDARPNLFVLIPNMKYKYPCLTMLLLCFEEECLYYNIPSLRTNKFTPSTDQMEAMDKLIDSMDLMDALDDDTGIKEAFALNKTLNPLYQHQFRTIAHKALKPKEPIPPISEELLNLIEMPQKVKERSKEAAEKVKELFPLEDIKVSTKKQWVLKNTKAGSQIPDDQLPGTSASLMNSDDSERNLVEVGTVTPYNDFIALLNRGEKFSTLCSQLRNVISDLVFKSMTIDKQKVGEAIMGYREQGKIMGAYYFNEWITEFKESLLNRNKTEFWDIVIVQERFGLITNEESETSTVTTEEAEIFYSGSSGAKAAAGGADDYIDADALFDDM